MKRKLLNLMVLVVIAASLQGCYGKFALTRKVYALNGQVQDKFLRSGLTWVFLIVPVYGLAGFVDFVAFNTIEFWSGRNPVVEAEKDFRYVDGADRYDIHAIKRGDDVKYTITHYNMDSYVDSLQVDWNKAQDTATSRFSSGGLVTENFASRDIDGLHVQVRQPGYLPQAVVIASR